MKKAIVKRRPAASHTAIVIILAIVAAVVIMPYILLILTSFRSTKEILQNPAVVWPIEWTLSGYLKVFTEVPFFKWFMNSVIITVSVTFLVLFTSTITGFVFAKYKFKGRETLFWIVLATMMVPSQVTMIPSFLVINELGLYNKLMALILPSMISAFGIFLCRQFIEDIPDSLCEAARIDGANSLTLYLRIIIPQIRPAIGALAIFTFLGTWNDYLGPLIMLSDLDRMTLPLALTFFSTNHSMDVGATMSATTLVMMPVTIVFLAFQKQFIKGISIAGMK